MPLAHAYLNLSSPALRSAVVSAFESDPGYSSTRVEQTNATCTLGDTVMHMDLPKEMNNLNKRNVMRLR